MDRSRAHGLGKALAVPGQPLRSRGETGRGLACLLTTLHPERALSLALVQHLTEEMPDIEFTLEDRPDVDVVWICGYERGASGLVRDVRRQHPSAVVVVTAREPMELWESEVLAAGADCASSWPLEYERLSQLLHQRAVERQV